MHSQEFVSDRAAQTGHAVVHAELEFAENDLAGERVAVGVQAVGGQSDEGIADTHARTVENFGTIGYPDDASDKIVVGPVIQAGHLRRLTTEEGTSGTFAGSSQTGDDFGKNGRIKFACAEIIEEEKRAGTHHGDVVHAMIDEVLPDGFVLPGQDGNFEFGADTVHARHKDRILHLRKSCTEKPAEPSYPAEHARSVRLLHKGRQAVFQGVAQVDIDPGASIGS
jgi:hypothetical protein